MDTMTNNLISTQGKTLWQLICERADATPDKRMALDEAGRTMTFGEFMRWAERVAAGQDEPRQLHVESRDADHKPALEEPDLRVVKALVDLRERAHEDEHEAERQQGDGELQGGEEFYRGGHE